MGGVAALSVCKETYVCAPPSVRGGSPSAKENTKPLPVTRGPRLWGDLPVLSMGLIMGL